MTKTKKTTKKRNYTYAVGRRKTATARIRLFKSKTVPETKSQLIVNGKPVEEYFAGEENKSEYRKPFLLTNTLTKLSVSAKVQGSGKPSQLKAVIHGISRALIKEDEKHRPILKKEGLLTRDPRAKESRKVGTGGKARRKKQSPKR